ncbi:carbohydrate porin [Paracoccus aestuarii]|uniref:Carbohydrate porin n=1 Tax=Paracoccus aestuarii TaxID=453842 RepID=A0A419A1U9_9RHOB|nr:carbohydrate porin [Paracoccus aestuarii]RJL06888.1 carbohydrate porin [Paracoccus aestuarii]WCQ99788.1 carbohydrate porin [Paracoccus aestuarii]
MKPIIATAAFCAAMGSTAVLAESPFSTTGYLRIGVGESDGGDLAAMQLNGAWAKYRLGNEDDFYGEFGVGLDAPLNNGSSVIGGIRYHVAGDSNDLTDRGSFDASLALREAWLGYRGLGAGAFEEAAVWAGRRYYKRKDIHINDFYYESYSNFDGYGLGVEDIALGFGKLSLAGFRERFNRVHTYDARIEDMPLAENWTGEVGLAFADARGDATGDNGFALRGHVQRNDFFGGYIKGSLMFSNGAAFGFSADGAPDVGKDRSLSRAQVHGLVPVADRTELFFVGLHQVDDNDGDKSKWSSVGIRPHYALSDNFAIATEIGYDRVSDEGGSRDLLKGTLAGIYTFGQSGFWDRPQLRAYVTRGSWSDVGAISKQAAYGTDTAGTSVGLQLETWF